MISSSPRHGVPQRLLRWLLGAVVLVVVAALVPASASTPRLWTISGRITTSDGAVPAGGVTIVDAANGTDILADLDTAGDFAASVPDGDYRVEARGEGVQTRWWPEAPDQASSDVVHVRDADVPDVDVVLPRTAHLTGRLTNADGTPVVGALVYVSRHTADGDYTDGGGTAVTDHDGRYGVSGLADGDYYVEGHVYGRPDTYYGNVARRDQQHSVTVSDGQDQTADLVFEQTMGTASGTLTLPAGDDPRLARAVLHRTTDDLDDSGWSASVTADGTWQVGAPSGTYHLELVYSGGGDPALDEWWNGSSGSPDESSAATVRVVGGRDTSGLDVTMAPSAQVRGTVTAPAGRTGATYVVLYRRASDGTFVPSRGANADSTGAYDVTGLEPGTYRVRFASRFAGVASQWFAASSDLADATDVIVPRGATVSGVDGSLGAQSGTISGRVTQGDTGAPVDQDTVEAFPLDGGSNTAETSTRPDGTYTLTGIDTGRYEVVAFGVSNHYHSTWWGGTEDRDDASTLVVSQGGAVSGVDVALSTGAVISGTVTGSDGDPPPQHYPYVVEATLYTFGTSGWAAGPSEPTDQHGDYEFAGLGPGDYRVEFSGDETDLSQWYDDAPGPAEATTIHLDEDQRVDHVDAQLHAGGRISGTVTDTTTGHGLLGATVTLTRKDGDDHPILNLLTATTSADGSWSVADLPQGDYAVEVTDAAAGFAPRWYRAASDAVSATSVSLAEGQSVDHVDVALQAGSTLSGRLTDVRGRGVIAPITVYRQDADGTWDSTSYSTSTDLDGDWTASDLPPGTYRIGCDVQADGPYVPVYVDSTAAGSMSFGAARTLTLHPGGGVAHLDLTLLDRATISGTVLDAGGDPVADEALTAVRVDRYVPTDSDLDRIAGGGTDDDGSFTLGPLPPGDYVLEISKDGDPFSYHGYWAGAGPPTPSRQAAQEIHVAAGDQVTDLPVTASETTGAITGQVAGPDGSPLAGVSVSADRSDGTVETPDVTTDAQGRYSLTVHQGEWYVEFRGPDTLAEQYYSKDEGVPVVIAVDSGATVAGIDARLEPGGTVSGRVTSASGDPIGSVEVRLVDSRLPFRFGGLVATDADGRYTFTNVTSGSYLVKAETDESGTGSYDGYEDAWWPSAADQVSAVPITVTAGSTDDGKDLVLQSSSSARYVTSSSAPRVQGTPAVGESLTATTGSWSVEPSGYRYQWLVGRQVVRGATGATYTPTPDDVGETVQVRVTADRAGYLSTTAVSATTAPVPGAPAPVITSSADVRIHGVPASGRRLVALDGPWTPSYVDVAYQWLADGQPIAGATDDTLLLTDAQQGQRISVTVTASTPGATSVTETSDPTDAVIRAPIRNVQAPEVTDAGYELTGKPTTATTGTWSLSGLTFAYQWYDGLGPIAGATSSTYVPTDGELNELLRVQVTASKAGYDPVSAYSPWTESVLQGPPPTTDPGGGGTGTGTDIPSPVRFPSLVGSPVVGGTLTVDPGTWTGDVTSFSYEWVIDGTEVPALDRRSYRVSPALVGHRVFVMVYAHTARSVSSAGTQDVGPIGLGRLAATTRPRMAGRPRVGGRLRVTPGRWNAPVQLTYRWQVGGRLVARTASYRPTAADRGRVVVCLVRVASPGYAPVRLRLRPAPRRVR